MITLLELLKRSSTSQRKLLSFVFLFEADKGFIWPPPLAPLPRPSTQLPPHIEPLTDPKIPSRLSSQKPFPFIDTFSNVLKS